MLLTKLYANATTLQVYFIFVFHATFICICISIQPKQLPQPPSTQGLEQILDDYAKLKSRKFMGPIRERGCSVIWVSDQGQQVGWSRTQNWHSDHQARLIILFLAQTCKVLVTITYHPYSYCRHKYSAFLPLPEYRQRHALSAIIWISQRVEQGSCSSPKSLTSPSFFSCFKQSCYIITWQCGSFYWYPCELTGSS